MTTTHEGLCSALQLYMAIAVNVSTAIGSYIFTTMSGSHFLSRGADVITSLKSNHKGY